MTRRETTGNRAALTTAVGCHTPPTSALCSMPRSRIEEQLTNEEGSGGRGRSAHTFRYARLLAREQIPPTVVNFTDPRRCRPRAAPMLKLINTSALEAGDTHSSNSDIVRTWPRHRTGRRTTSTVPDDKNAWCIRTIKTDRSQETSKLERRENQSRPITVLFNLEDSCTMWRAVTLHQGYVLAD